MLDQNLTSAGHTSIVIAAKGSKIKGTLIPSPPARGKLTDAAREAGRAAHRRLIAEALAKYPIDRLIHLHGLDFHTYVPTHGRSSSGSRFICPSTGIPRAIFRRGAPFYLQLCLDVTGTVLVPARRRTCWNPSRTVFNVDRLEGNFPKRDYALSLGRICPEKGVSFRSRRGTARPIRSCCSPAKCSPTLRTSSTSKNEIVPASRPPPPFYRAASIRAQASVIVRGEMRAHPQPPCRRPVRLLRWKPWHAGRRSSRLPPALCLKLWDHGPHRFHREEPAGHGRCHSQHRSDQTRSLPPRRALAVLRGNHECPLYELLPSVDRSAFGP